MGHLQAGVRRLVRDSINRWAGGPIHFDCNKKGLGSVPLSHAAAVQASGHYRISLRHKHKPSSMPPPYPDPLCSTIQQYRLGFVLLLSPEKHESVHIQYLHSEHRVLLHWSCSGAPWRRGRYPFCVTRDSLKCPPLKQNESKIKVFQPSPPPQPSKRLPTTAFSSGGSRAAGSFNRGGTVVVNDHPHPSRGRFWSGAGTGTGPGWGGDGDGSPAAWNVFVGGRRRSVPPLFSAARRTRHGTPGVREMGGGGGGACLRRTGLYSATAITQLVNLLCCHVSIIVLACCLRIGEDGADKS